MSNRSPLDPSELSKEHSDESPTRTARIRHSVGRVSSRLVAMTVWATFLVVITSPVVAQTDVGDVYCGTGVETGISIVFGAIAGLGLPATGYYLSKSGLDYMRAGGNPEKKNKAKEELVMAGTGFGIVVLALISPELIDNVGSQMGFSFSDCVKPF